MNIANSVVYLKALSDPLKRLTNGAGYLRVRAYRFGKNKSYSGTANNDGENNDTSQVIRRNVRTQAVLSSASFSSVIQKLT